ncbi:MAG TPA: glycosyltransferase family 4 protein [Candidatus Paceibacterota bacterium]
MKILVISQRYYPDQFRINEITVDLVKKGHEITVITGLPQDNNGYVRKNYRWWKNRKEEWNGVQIYRTFLTSRRKNVLSLISNYLTFSISSTFKILRLLKEYDQIFVFQVSPITQIIPAIVMKKRAKIPLVIYIQDLWPMSVTTVGVKTDSFFYKALRKFCSYLYNQGDQIAITSMSYKQYLIDELHVTVNCTYLPQFAEDLFTQNLQKRTNGKFNVVFAGSIGAAQSVETIVLAANELRENKEILFWIIGGGRRYDEVVKLTKDLKLDNINFTGQLPIEEMPYYHELADLFVVTLADNPLINITLPAKVQTYMACGKPIVATAYGEISTLFDNAKCGKYVKPSDYVGLSELIKEYYEGPEKVVLYGNNGLQYYINNFTKNQFYLILSGILQKKL